MRSVGLSLLLVPALIYEGTTDGSPPGDPAVDRLLAEASTHFAEGEYGCAEAFAEEALKILHADRKHSTEEAAKALHVLSALDRRLGRYERAEERCDAALALREKLQGEEHASVAESLELAAAIKDDKGLEVHNESARRALAIREATSKSIGDQVPALVLLARWELHGGRNGPARASELVERALGIAMNADGCEPILAQGFNALDDLRFGGELLQRIDEAETHILETLRGKLGPAHPSSGNAMARLAAVKAARGQFREAHDLFRESVPLRVGGLTDEELCCVHEFPALDWDYFYFNDRKRIMAAHSELCLVEMGRRGGTTIEAFLAGIAGERLELVTALRRAQRKRDPIEVVFEGPPERDCEVSELPVFEACLTNVDEEKQTVAFTEGGNYRTGRLERWRFEVVDAAGVPVPPLPSPGGFGGGVFGYGRLGPGQSWGTKLEMGKHVDIRVPGEYSVWIQYHDRLEIADLPFIDDLIISSSKSIRLCVRPREVEVSRTELDEVAAQLMELDARMPLKVLAGGYEPAVHDFIAPDSPQGKLLSLGWKAVPVLLEEVLEDDLDSLRRAWILSLLFAITGRNDPRRKAEALGAHSFRESGWALFGSRPGGVPSGGIGFGSTGTAGGGSPDPRVQRELAQSWRERKQLLRVKVKP